MSVDHGSFDIFVPQKLLNGSDIMSFLKQVGSKAMSKRVAVYLFMNTCCLYGFAKLSPEIFLMDMVAVA
jgi:hypothetical protein